MLNILLILRICWKESLYKNDGHDTRTTKFKFKSLNFRVQKRATDNG